MLCVTCLPGHLEKGTWHQQVPMHAKAYFRNPNYFDKLKAREMTTSEGIKELEDNLNTITECEQVLRTKTAAAIEEIIKYKENTLAELAARRVEMEAALLTARNEVAEHLYEDPYEPTSQLSKSLWNHQPGNLKLFEYTTEGKYEVKITINEPKLQPDPPPLSEGDEESEEYEEENEEGEEGREEYGEEIDYEQEDESSSEEYDIDSLSPILYIIKPNIIGCHHVHAQSTSKFVTLQSTIKVNQTTAYCILTSGSLWVCGGNYPYTSLVYEIDPLDGEVYSKEPMQLPRGGHAVLQYKNCVYVFGGFDGELISHCERYVFSVKSWESRAYMITPRYYFNPCSLRQYVYIFGGKGTNLAEMYNIGTDTFTALSLCLPESGQTSAVFLNESKIAIIQKGVMTHWDEGQEDSEEYEIGSIDSCWGNACPIYWEGCVYIPHTRIQVLDARVD